MNETKSLPPSASKSGRNAHYLTCNAVGRRVNYAVCLFTIEKLEAGKQLSEVACNEAVCGGGCKAKEMRAEEEAAGKALYFLERKVPVEPDPRPMAKPKPIKSSIWTARTTPIRAALDAAKGGADKTPSTPSKKKTPTEPTFNDKGLAQAVTAAVKEHVGTTKKMSGLGLLDRIKLNKEK